MHTGIGCQIFNKAHHCINLCMSHSNTRYSSFKGGYNMDFKATLIKVSVFMSSLKALDTARLA